MKNKFFFTLIIAMLIILSSCMKEGVAMIFGDQDEDLANYRMEQVFDALKNHDAKALKSCFSKKALSESKNIDDDIEKLFDFIQGELISCEMSSGDPMVEDTRENGCDSKQLISWNTFKTDKHSYGIWFVDYPINEIDPDNKGLYSLRILKSKDEHKITGYWQDYVIPGINIIEFE